PPGMVDRSTLKAQRGTPLVSSSRGARPKREGSAEQALGADRRTLACLRGTLWDACEAVPRPWAKGARLLGAPPRRLRLSTAQSGRRSPGGGFARPRAGAAPASAYGVPPETPSDRGEMGVGIEQNVNMVKTALAGRSFPESRVRVRRRRRRERAVRSD